MYLHAMHLSYVNSDTMSFAQHIVQFTAPNPATPGVDFVPSSPVAHKALAVQVSQANANDANREAMTTLSHDGEM